MCSGGDYFSLIIYGGSTKGVVLKEYSAVPQVSDQISLTGSTTIYIKVVSDSSVSFKIKVSQHFDRAQLQYGGRWQAALAPGSANSSLIPECSIYYPASSVIYFAFALMEDENINWIVRLLEDRITIKETVTFLSTAALTWEAELPAVAIASTVAAAEYKLIASYVKDGVIVPAIKKISVEALIRVVGIPEWTNEDPTADYGAHVTLYRGAKEPLIERWVAPEATWPKGSIGQFLAFPKPSGGAE